MNIQCCDYENGLWNLIDTVWDDNESGHLIKNLLPGHTYSFRTVDTSIPSPHCSSTTSSSSSSFMPSLPSATVTIPHETGTWQQDHLIRRYKRLSKVIGRGRCSCVEEAQDNGTGQKVALKQIERCRQTQCATRNEYQILGGISHHNIVHCLALFENAPTPGIDTLVLELVCGLDICSFVCQSETVDLGILQLLTIQLMKALDFMKEKNVTHCDIKPENLMVEVTDKPILKIIDFGSAVMNDQHRFYPISIDLEFSAPELLQCPPVVSNAADVWSAGVVLYILISGVSPFLDESYEETIAHILNQDFSFPEEYFHDIPESPKTLIRNLLSADLSSRITPIDALQSIWTREGVSNVTIHTTFLKSFIQRRLQQHRLIQHIVLS